MNFHQNFCFEVAAGVAAFVASAVVFAAYPFAAAASFDSVSVAFPASAAFDLYVASFLVDAAAVAGVAVPIAAGFCPAVAVAS